MKMMVEFKNFYLFGFDKVSNKSIASHLLKNNIRIDLDISPTMVRFVGSHGALIGLCHFMFEEQEATGACESIKPYQAPSGLCKVEGMKLGFFFPKHEVLQMLNEQGLGIEDFKNEGETFTLVGTEQDIIKTFGYGVEPIIKKY